MDDYHHDPLPERIDISPLPPVLNEFMFDVPQHWKVGQYAELYVTFDCSPTVLESYKEIRVIMYMTKPRGAIPVDHDFEFLGESRSVSTEDGAPATGRTSKYEKDWRRFEFNIGDDIQLLHPGPRILRIVVEGDLKEISEGAQTIAAETSAGALTPASIDYLVLNKGKVKFARTDEPVVIRHQ